MPWNPAYCIAEIIRVNNQPLRWWQNLEKSYLTTKAMIRSKIRFVLGSIDVEEPDFWNLDPASEEILSLCDDVRFVEL